MNLWMIKMEIFDLELISEQLFVKIWNILNDYSILFEAFNQ